MKKLDKSMKSPKIKKTKTRIDRNATIITVLLSTALCVVSGLLVLGVYSIMGTQNDIKDLQKENHTVSTERHLQYQRHHEDVSDKFHTLQQQYVDLSDKNNVLEKKCSRFNNNIMMICSALTVTAIAATFFVVFVVMTEIAMSILDLKYLYDLFIKL